MASLKKNWKYGLINKTLLNSAVVATLILTSNHFKFGIAGVELIGHPHIFLILYYVGRLRH